MNLEYEKIMTVYKISPSTFKLSELNGKHGTIVVTEGSQKDYVWFMTDEGVCHMLMENDR